MTDEFKNAKITGILSVPGVESGERWTPEWDVLFTDPGHVRFVDPQTGEHVRIVMRGEEASALGSLLMRMTDELRKAHDLVEKGNISKPDANDAAADGVTVGMVMEKEIESLRAQIKGEQEGMLTLRRKYGAFKDETAEQWIARLYGEAQLHREAEIKQINGWVSGKLLTDETVELAGGVAQQVNLLKERLTKVENQEGPFLLALHAEQGLPGGSMAVAEVVVCLEFMPAESRLEIERIRPTRICDVQSLAGNLMAKYHMGEKAFRSVSVAEMDRLKPEWREIPWQTGDRVDPERGARLNPAGSASFVVEQEIQQPPVPLEVGVDQGEPGGDRTAAVRLGADGLPVDLQAEAIREVLQHNPRFERWNSVTCPACDRGTLGATRSAGMIPRITLKCANCGFQVDI